MAARCSCAVPLTASAASAASTSPAAATATGSRTVGCLSGRLDVDSRSILNLVHAFEYDHLVGFESRCDCYVIAFGCLDRDRAEFRSLILTYDVDKSTL